LEAAAAGGCHATGAPGKLGPIGKGDVKAARFRVALTVFLAVAGLGVFGERALRGVEDPEGEPGEDPGKDAPEEKRAPEPPSQNLSIPGNLPDDVRKIVAGAVKAYEAAAGAKVSSEKAWTQAITKLKAASAKAPDSSLLQYYLGLAQLKKGKVAEARKCFDKAAKLNPQFHEALIEVARHQHRSEKNLEGALATANRVLALRPSDEGALEEKIRLLVSLDRLKEAKEMAIKADKARPKEGWDGLVKTIDREITGPNWGTAFQVETENYIVLCPVSQAYAQEIANHAELIRRAYDKVFSEIPKPDRKFRIYVYADRESYLRNGNPPQALGFYSPIFRNLVLFKRPPQEETLATLYHEAFHQYLHDYNEAAPQWFNEGVGEYFGAFYYSREGKKEFMRSRPNKGRLNNAKFFISAKKCPPAADLMVMTQREMYQDGAVHYAQAWAMIYFMIEGKKPQYRNALMSYFQAFQKGLDAKEAFAATFGRLDMQKFDAEWKGFIMGLSEE
jgi:tetratricopeptide (TPR) repeat protein